MLCRSWDHSPNRAINSDREDMSAATLYYWTPQFAPLLLVALDIVIATGSLPLLPPTHCQINALPNSATLCH